jgi:L-arabinonolactonase
MGKMRSANACSGASTLNEGEGRAPIGGFYRLNCDLTLERLPLKSVVVANSSCFSTDGRTMYYCDSWDKAIRCCDYDPDSGAISNDRVFVALGDLPGEPDGSTVDADGFVWNALWGGGKIVRFAPDGSVDRTIDVPASQPTCLAFGGAGFDTLYVTSARDGLASAALETQPHAGGVFAMQLDGIRGLPEQRFLPYA